MKKKHCLRLFVFAASALLLYSCVKDVWEENGDKQAGFTLEQAKAFYVSRSEGAIRQVDFEHASCGHAHASGTRGHPEEDALTPLWFRARQVDNGKVSTQVVPLDGGLERALYQRYVGYAPVEVSGRLDTRLVIQRLNATGEMRYFIETVIRESSLSQTRNWNRYSRASDLVIISDADGHYLYSYRRQDGRSREVRLKAFLQTRAQTQAPDELLPALRFFDPDSQELGGGGGPQGFICPTCGNAYWTQCPICNSTDIPGVEITICRKCGQNLTYGSCLCCPRCGNYPCTCVQGPEYACPYCGNPYCYGECRDNTGSGSGSGDGSGGSGSDDFPGDSLIDEPRYCPFCHQKNCQQIHTDCTSILPGSKSSSADLYGNMGAIGGHDYELPDGTVRHYPSYQEYLTRVASSPNVEHAADMKYDPDRGYYLYGIETGTLNHVSIGGSNPGVVASIHSHPTSLPNPPSPLDALTAAGCARYNPGFECLFTYMPDGTVYALYIEDRSKVETFHVTLGREVDQQTAGFLESSEMGKLYDNVIKLYSFQQLRYSQEQQAYALAYILGRQDSGIRLLRRAPGESGFTVLRTNNYKNDRYPHTGGWYIIPTNCP